jgi:hypothetical protein
MGTDRILFITFLVTDDNAEIEASGNNVFVTRWENNQTSNDPVMRISQDSGNTFGPVLNLAANDTLRAAQ